MYHIWMTLCPIYQFWAKTSNNVSEFTHSNWIMPSYYSSPKHKRVCSPNASLTSVHSNLKHWLAILTECFSPLRSVLHNLPCWSPKQKSTSIMSNKFSPLFNSTSALLESWIWNEAKPTQHYSLSCTLVTSQIKCWCNALSAPPRVESPITAAANSHLSTKHLCKDHQTLCVHVHKFVWVTSVTLLISILWKPCKYIKKHYKNNIHSKTILHIQMRYLHIYGGTDYLIQKALSVKLWSGKLWWHHNNRPRMIMWAHFDFCQYLIII